MNFYERVIAENEDIAKGRCIEGRREAEKRKINLQTFIEAIVNDPNRLREEKRRKLNCMKINSNSNNSSSSSYSRSYSEKLSQTKNIV